MTPVLSSSQMGLVSDRLCSYLMGPTNCFPSETTMNAWQEILGYLKAKVNTQSYQTWLRPTRFSHVNQEELVVRVPNREFQDWIQEHYGSLINEALSQLHLDAAQGSTMLSRKIRKRSPSRPGTARLFKPSWILSRSTTS